MRTSTPHSYASEAERVQAIEDFEQNIALPGHGAIIDAAKKDGHSTPGDVALAIIHAEQTAVGLRVSSPMGYRVEA